jgi:hypothetical protein
LNELRQGGVIGGARTKRFSLEKIMFRTTLSLSALFFVAGLCPAALAMPIVDTNPAETATENADLAERGGNARKASTARKKTKKTTQKKRKRSSARHADEKRRAANAKNGQHHNGHAAAAKHHNGQAAAAKHHNASQKRRNALRARAAWAWQWQNAPVWAYGVFLHPHHHRGSKPVRTFVPTPKRSVDRAGTLSLGIRGGTYLSGYESATRPEGVGYGDFGLGVAARARLAEPLGIEVSWQHHDQSFEEGSSRVTQPLSASVQLFAVPWATVSPYALAGVTWTTRTIDDSYFDGVTQNSVQIEDELFGPHIGFGVELNMSESASINFEARSIGYLNVAKDDPSLPSSLQGTMGLNLHF